MKVKKAFKLMLNKQEKQQVLLQIGHEIHCDVHSGGLLTFASFRFTDGAILIVDISHCGLDQIQ